MPSTSNHFTRRNLLKGTLALGAAGSFISKTTSAENTANESFKLNKGDVILFQGDSITDAGRKKEILVANNSDALGRGYAAMIAGAMLTDYPELGLQFYNRGISGNKIPDLAARWEEDTIKLKPKVLSIMIGINDLWHTVAFGSKYKGTIADYEEGYRKLIQQTQSALPEIKIIICEPFELRKWKEFDKYREVAKKIAEEFKLTFVPFHSALLTAEKSPSTDGKFWASDGIHPSIPGHTVMLNTWRKATGL